jgi:Protein of unknown function DUF262
MKKQQPTQEQLKESQRRQEVEALEYRIERNQIPEPTRLFKVGDQVKIGALQNVTVTEVLFGGRGYRIHYDFMGQEYGRPIRKTGDQIWDWTSVLPVTAFGKGESFCIKDDVQIRFFNNDIDSLIHKVYHSGVDFNPDYQRGLVWTADQKTALLDSIFNNIEIGKFTFIRYPFSEGRKFYYEILDGKQRLSTICEFYEDRIEWKGMKFTELCAEDARHFLSFPIIQGEVGEITEQQIYKLFVKMNTSGTPVSQEHLNRIKALIQ